MPFRSVKTNSSCYYCEVEDEAPLHLFYGHKKTIFYDHKETPTLGISFCISIKVN